MKNKTDKKGFYCGCATLGDKTIISTNCPVHFEKAEHLFKVKPTDRANEKIPCTCPKGGMYEREDGSTFVCNRCSGSEWVTPEETAHSGLIDTPTAQKRQKVDHTPEQKECWICAKAAGRPYRVGEDFCDNHKSQSEQLESKVSDWEEEFDKRTHPFITYEEMKSIISDILHKYFIPKKELAELLENLPASYKNWEVDDDSPYIRLDELKDKLDL